MSKNARRITAIEAEIRRRHEELVTTVLDRVVSQLSDDDVRVLIGTIDKPEAKFTPAEAAAMGRYQALLSKMGLSAEEYLSRWLQWGLEMAAAYR